MADYKVIDAEQLDADLTTVADAIRSKGGTTEQLLFPSGMVTAIGAIQSGGGSGENLLDYVNDLCLEYQYIEKDILNISFGKYVNNTNIRFPNLYSASGFRHIVIDFLGESTNSTVSLDSKLRFNTDIHEDTLEIIELPIIEKIPPSTFNRAFQNRKKLKEIRTIIDASNCTSFGNYGLDCPKLETIRFVENTIKYTLSMPSASLLSDESIQSIIDGLATVETAQTLKLNNNVIAKLTETQLATITGKNWTLA